MSGFESKRQASKDLLKQALDALDDALICCHIGTVESFPTAKDALNALIDWHVATALDPEVSSDAQALVDRGTAVAEPLIDEMDAVASRYAHKLALDLECVLSNYIGPWYDTAMQTLSDYRMAMNRIHERESPTFMGEPDVRNRTSGGSAA
ncbi:hypothetical protein UFOVP1147_52 [uncultured Caudovirales phage]|uniref:Uncharacterized protein n=1 Tax=uncultured Caudovirales phage TaxID=2100421 RepID=A0A6J5QPB8_9CAUD|nr:hypothetical protein UFOVP484_21 [uncultured Caudovirales phage]CAB4163673.1 hypothetical protein UFOVP808_37 [uncultured Caudovirales phage]CAB4175990.1 hypothetical protein UFOVP994_48 [uncultured Caudovirales phage]CAB4186529.1 hypothetical protein UFOVP1147_52 [uncultured Caudovirales phage]CAB4217620.1 hypothetical protein UFOVP1594_48 [uncultured Caudovirales phage]